MALASGARLGPYEIVAPLGEGGMGDVYRARDTRLDRSVALKVSKEAFNDRFEREARAVAALNHPNICTLYDVGPNYLVMELVEGAPLSGPLPVEKAVECAGQILDALEAAHRQGITHRDLKPANILVTKQGIKLLDFGLATKASPMGGSASDGATVAALTQQGQIVGTLQYMAPEQLQGQQADARSDIFAFGCVLYELLSGKRAFDGASAASVIAAILERDPPSLLGSFGAPEPVAALDRVIATCLAKDPDARFQTARDLKRALTWAMEPVAGSAAAPIAVAWWQRPVVMAGTIVFALAAGLVAANAFRPAPSIQAPPVTRFELPIDPGFKVWSPDGTQLAWLTRERTPGGAQQIFVRRRDDFEARLVDVGPGVRKSLVFSPDGEWLAYTHAPVGHAAATEIRKVRVTGGPSELVARVTVTGINAAALSWEAGHMWVASGQVLQAIPESGGAVRTAITLPENRVFVSGRLQFINGGRDLLFVVSDRTATGDRAAFGLWTAPLAGGQPREVMNRVICFALTTTGDLLYTQVDGLLWARRFQEKTVEVNGEPVALMELSYAGTEAFALSPTGMLAFGRRVPVRREPVWLQRASGRVDVVHASLESAAARYQLSPDGRFLLIEDGGALRAFDLERQQGFQVSTPANLSVQSYFVARTGAIFVQAAEGTAGLARPAGIFRVDFPGMSPPVKIDITADHFLRGVSPDGQRLFVLKRGTRDAVLINIDGTGPPVPVEASAEFSPDWRWVLYSKGRELWVRPEPAGAQAPGLIGQGNPFGAFWSQDGRELFYRDGNGRWTTVTVKSEPSKASIMLSQPAPLNIPEDLDLVALAPGGTRFLASRSLPSPPATLAIVENFFEELRAKVPVK